MLRHVMRKDPHAGTAVAAATAPTKPSSPPTAQEADHSAATIDHSAATESLHPAVADHSGAAPDHNAAVEVMDPELLLRLSGPGGAHLRVLEKEFAVHIGMRGHTIHLNGPHPAVTQLERVLLQLVDVMGRGHALSEREILRACRTLKDHPEMQLQALFDDAVSITSGRKVITPKGVAQQHYLQAMRKRDIVFGVGPAGTGKTYLAMAMAVKALQERQVKRILLTRPAVEAGEKLGFLPGDLADKVDPYLRPLFDALHDMLDTEKVQNLLQRGVIEIAPLAFMRGRTLNHSFVVLDEAQNTTIGQMKMFLTRLGFDAKAV
ncbi:MAG: PhoH family protein, partial [Polyangiales bacterium]